MNTKMRGHTVCGLSMGRGFLIVSSTKQKFNTRSSTEAEIAAVNYCMTAILCTRYWLDAQGYNVFEKKSINTIKYNGKASRRNFTKHINIR